MLSILLLVLCFGCSSAPSSKAPTSDAAAIFTMAAQTASVRLTMTQKVITYVPPTDVPTVQEDFDSMDQTPVPGAETPNPATGTQAQTGITDTPAAPATTPTPAAVSNGAACIPANPPQTGKVLDIIDGDTIKVMIDGKTYTVRYIGVDAPEYVKTKEFYAAEARQENSKLVFAKDITLIKDKSDTDPAGRLLRYVKIGETFVNLELVTKGFAKALSSPPDSACDTSFASAQDQASAAKTGLWNK